MQPCLRSNKELVVGMRMYFQTLRKISVVFVVTAVVTSNAG